MSVFLRRWFQVSLVVLLAAVLRLDAAVRMGLDWDEPVYVEVSTYYAQVMDQGQPALLLDYAENMEHPLLVKLVHAKAIQFLGPEKRLSLRIGVCRLVSVLAGLATVGAVAMMEPLAGLLLAVHTLHVKYSAEAYLEAIPAFLAFLAFYYGISSKDHRSPWFWLAAVAWGGASAGKYLHALSGLVVLGFLAWDVSKRRLPAWVPLAWPVLGFLSFFLMDPYLWPDPGGRLASSLAWHPSYAHEMAVSAFASSWFQPIRTLGLSLPWTWHPEALFIPLDGPVLVLGIVGLSLGRRRRLDVGLAIWFLLGLGFLCAWPTRWPQHSMLVVIPLCLAAARGIHGLRGLVARLVRGPLRGP